MPSTLDFTTLALPHRANEPSVGGGWRRTTLAASVLEAARNSAAARRALPCSRWSGPGRSHTPFDLAVESYEAGDWAAAFQAATAGAEAGDPAAAKLALLMLRYGASLYGVELQAEPRCIARWAKCVIEAASAPGPASASIAGSTASQRAARSTSRRTASPSSITAIA